MEAQKGKTEHIHIIFKNLTCADWPKWPKTSPEWHKNKKNWNCFGNLYQTSYLNSWILIFAPADCTKLKSKDKPGQIQKTSWHFSGYIVQLGCPKLSFTNGLINKAKGWRVDIYSSNTRYYKDVKRWKKWRKTLENCVYKLSCYHQMWPEVTSWECVFFVTGTPLLLWLATGV